MWLDETLNYSFSVNSTAASTPGDLNTETPSIRPVVYVFLRGGVHSGCICFIS